MDRYIKVLEIYKLGRWNNIYVVPNWSTDSTHQYYTLVLS